MVTQTQNLPRAQQTIEAQQQTKAEGVLLVEQAPSKHGKQTLFWEWRHVPRLQESPGHL